MVLAEAVEQVIAAVTENSIADKDFFITKFLERLKNK